MNVGELIRVLSAMQDETPVSVSLGMHVGIPKQIISSEKRLQCYPNDPVQPNSIVILCEFVPKEINQ